MYTFDRLKIPPETLQLKESKAKMKDAKTKQTHG